MIDGEYLIKLLEMHSGLDRESIDRILSERYVRDDIVSGRKLIASYLGVSERMLDRWKIKQCLPECIKAVKMYSGGRCRWTAKRVELIRYVKEQM